MYPKERNKVTLDGGFEVIVKPARSKMQGARNYALKQAAEILKKSELTRGKQVEIAWLEEPRCVKVAGAAAFKQAKGETRGRFEDGFAHLSLP